MISTRTHKEGIEVVKNRPMNQIYVFDNLIPKDKCKELIDFMEDGKLENEKKLNPVSKVNAYCYYLNTDKYPKVSIYFNNLMCYLKKVFCERYDLSLDSYDEICFRKIVGRTQYHIDGVGGYVNDKYIKMKHLRNLSFIVGLNDNYEGGELVFPAQNFKIKLKCGQAVAFPPYWTHPHYANEPENDTFRYTINTWLY
jgi:hypothetical protein